MHQSTVAELLTRLDRDYRLRQRKSHAQAKSHWKPISEFFGSCDPYTISGDHLQEYALHRQTLGKSSATINRELSGLQKAFKLARIQWPGFERLPETGLRQGTYTREEVERLAMALPPHVRPVLWFGYYTGRRKSEILAITWGDIEWQTQSVIIRASTTKTSQPDRIPLTGALQSVLSSLPAGTPGTPIFTYRGKPLRSFVKSWKAALRATGLKDKLFHDLRRTAVTDMEEAGVPRGTAMAITGHKTFGVYQRYNIVRQESIKQGLEALQTFRQGQ